MMLIIIKPERKARKLIHKVAQRKHDKSKAEYEAWLEQQKDHVLRHVMEDWTEEQNGD